MAKKTTSKTSEKTEKSSTTPHFWGLNPMVSMLGVASYTGIVNECAQFVSARFEKDMQLQRDILNCRSVDELMRVQTAFYQETAAEYSAHMQRLSALVSEATALGWSEATTAKTRDYDDVPV
jgi:hypothetical protein